MIDDEEDYYDEDDEGGGDGGGALGLGSWVEESYVGDTRFELVDMIHPGQVDGEDFRVRLAVRAGVQFFVSLFSEDAVVRVGLAVEEEDESLALEAGILEEADSMTELLEGGMETDDEVEYEMQHFHDDVYYFSSDLPYDTEDRLRTSAFRELVESYLDGYINAFSPFFDELQ